MSDDLDTYLRAELRDLASGSPGPVGLADTALRLAASRRRRRTAAAAAGIAAVVTVAVTGAVGVLPLHMTGAASQQLPQRSAAQRQTIVAYRMVDGPASDPRNDQSRLLDPATGRYVPVDVAYLYVSPDGSRVAAVDTDRAPTRIGLASRSELVARGASAIRWLHLPATTFAGWSPDGRQLLISDRAGPDLRVLVVDGGSGRLVRNTRVPAALLDSETGFPYLWFSADGQHLVTTQRAVGNRPAIVRFLDLDGTLARQVTVPGALWLFAHPFSTDGRHMLLVSQDGLKLLVADTTTGQILGRIPVGDDGDLGVVGWYDSDHIVTARRLGGADLQSTLLLAVLDLHGERLGTVSVPGAPGGRQLEVGLAGAAPPGGAAPLF